MKIFLACVQRTAAQNYANVEIKSRLDNNQSQVTIYANDIILVIVQRSTKTSTREPSLIKPTDSTLISVLCSCGPKILNYCKAMEYFDEYDYYNFDHVATAVSHSRKGRSKREATQNTNRPNPAGHERKITEKLRNTEKNKILAKGPRSK